MLACLTSRMFSSSRPTTLEPQVARQSRFWETQLSHSVTVSQARNS